MKQQENMILNQLNQYKNLYLQASNENAHLKHAVSKHEDELEANRKTIESMDSRILELEENQKEWDKEKAQLESQRDCYKKERDDWAQFSFGRSSCARYLHELYGLHILVDDSQYSSSPPTLHGRRGHG